MPGLEVATETIRLQCKGHTDIVDITPYVQSALDVTGFREGTVHVFAVGSTAGITDMEYEPGLAGTDMAAVFEKIAPYGALYAHNKTWGDDNGAAHIRASLTGGSFSVPFRNGALLLGAWQQIVYIDFDTRPRSREVIVQVMGTR